MEPEQAEEYEVTRIDGDFHQRIGATALERGITGRGDRIARAELHVQERETTGTTFRRTEFGVFAGAHGRRRIEEFDRSDATRCHEESQAQCGDESSGYTCNAAASPTENEVCESNGHRIVLCFLAARRSPTPREPFASDHSGDRKTLRKRSFESREPFSFRYGSGYVRTRDDLGRIRSVA